MLPRKRALLEHAFCLALLTAVPVVVLLPVLMGDALPLDLRDLLFTPPWQEARPAGLEPSDNTFSELDAKQYYPAYHYLNEAAREGGSLLWNDGEGIGMPFFALWRNRVASPFSLPFHVLPLGLALAVSVLAKLILAGWCAYYAARRFAFPRALSFLIALSFQLGAPLTLLPAAPISDALPWLPLLVLRLERLSLGDMRAWPRAAVVLALIALAGSPEALAGCLIFSVLYLVARRLLDGERVRTRDALTGLMLTVFFGLALVAVQWVPYIEFLRHGGWHRPETAVGLPMSGLLALLAPILGLQDVPGGASRVAVLHVGFLPILLLPLWLAVRRFVEKSHRRQLEAFLVSSVALAAIPLVAGSALGRVPFLEQLNPWHFAMPFGLAFAFLAAGALEEWVRLDPEQCKVALRRLLLFIPILWGVYFGALYAGTARMVLAHGTVYFAIGTAVATLLLLIVTLLRPKVRILGYALAAVAGLGLWWGFQPATPRTEPDLAFPETNFIRTVRGLDTLVAGTRELRSWPLAYHDIRQVYTSGGAYLDRHEDFLAQAERNPLLLRRTGAQTLLLTKEAVRGPFARIRHALSIHEIFASGAVLMQDLEAQPRARMIYAGRPMADYDPSLLSPDLPPLIEGGALPSEDNGATADTTLVDDEHGSRVSVHVAKTQPGMLVLADAYYPGWKAEVDGAPAPIWPVDAVFRGVELGMGDHDVTFRYEPLSLRLGGLVSLAALLVVGFNLLPKLRRRR